MNTAIPGISQIQAAPPQPGVQRPQPGTWRTTSQLILTFVPEIGIFMRNSPGNDRKLNDDEVRAYSAPFPDLESRGSALRFPVLIPPTPTVVDFPTVIEQFSKWDKPVLLIWGDADGVFPIETSGESMHQLFKTSNQPIRIKGGTHFVQESAPEQISSETIKFLKAN